MYTDKDAANNYHEMIELYEWLKIYIKNKNSYQFERWKAGGFCIDEDIISMYPTMGKVLEKCGVEI